MTVEHERMGFHEGWGLCTDQLEALVRSRSASGGGAHR